MKKIFALIILVLLISCNNKKPFEKRVAKLIGSPVFRGVSLGTSYTEVLNKENKKYLHFPDTSMLQYAYLVSDTEEYRWAYIFDNDRLKEIQFDAYLGQEED